MFLLAPDGQFLSRRWRNAAAVPAVGMLFCTLSVLISNPTTFDLQSRGRRSGPRPAPLVRLPPDRRRTGRVCRLHGRSAEKEPKRDSPAAPTDRPVRGRVGHRYRVGRRGPEQQRWRADLGGLSTAVRRLPADPGPVLHRRTALPALRHRGDRQPDGGRGGGHRVRRRSATPPSSSPWARRWTARRAASGCPCWRPPWSPWRSSRFAAGWSGSRTGWPTAPGPALRSAVRLQRPPRRDAVPGDPATGRGRRGRAGRVGTPGRGEPRGAGRADDVSPLGPRRRRWHRRARGRGTHGEHPTGHHRGVDPQGTPTSAVRHPAADGDLRPGGGRLPQRGVGEPAGGTRGRARPHHAGARRLALEDHRGGRRGTADPRGGHLARGAATPGRQCPTSSPVLAKPSLSGRPRTGSTSSWPPPTTRSSRSAS